MTSSDSVATSSAAVLKTLLLSDLVGSTQLVERLGDERAFALFGRHDRLARDLIQAHGGREIDKTDGFLILFDRPIDAVRYAVAYHQAMASLSAESGADVASRVGIHLGEVYLRTNPAEDVARGAKPLEVEGLAKPVAARLMSLATARQTLLTRAAFDLARRAAVGDEQGERALVWLAHGAYLFKGVDEPVKVFEVGVEGVSPLVPPPDSAKVARVRSDETILGWRPAPGQGVPQRPHWQLERKLGEGGFGEVWLARHAKTGEQRVLKFCFDEQRLQGLQREVTLFRLLKETLGAREDIARILDWSFDQAPYFVESEFTAGGSLVDWAAEHGGIQAMPLARRLELVAQVAEALAAAHSVGVLHKDLKPANVLVDCGRDGRLQARLTDFGVGLVTDRDRLAAAGITALGFDHTMLEDPTAMTGTQLYLAPELLEGKPPTLQADVFALGVLLYQVVVGDLQRALAPGWERAVEDDLLREDVAALVDGSPERRLADAAEAARRLRRLEARRAERAAAEQARREAEAARLALERTRKRRKLVIAAGAILVIFAGAMLERSLRIARWARQAEQERARAEEEAKTARQVSGFLISLFEGADPGKARGEEVTARQLLDRGAERIASVELDEQPVQKARFSQSLGNLYFKLGLYDQAEKLYAQSVELQQRHGGQVDATVATNLMNLASVKFSRGQLDEARSLYEQALAIKQEALGAEHEDVADLLVNLSTVSLYQGRREEAVTLAERAAAIYEKAPGDMDPKLARALEALGWALSEVGRHAEAEAALRRALTITEASQGADHPTVANILVNLAVALEAEERLDEAEAHYARALAIRHKVLPADHPLISYSLRKLGMVHLEQGRVGEAGQEVEEALAIAQRALGEEHPLVADSLVALARLELRRGGAAKARPLLERALAMREKLLGPDHPSVQEVRQELEAL